jgi:hypothetical protein
MEEAEFEIFKIVNFRYQDSQNCQLTGLDSPFINHVIMELPGSFQSMSTCFIFMGPNPKLSRLWRQDGDMP